MSRMIVTITLKRETVRSPGTVTKKGRGVWWMRRRKVDDVRERRMECLMGPFQGESFTGYVTFTRNVELPAYHAWSCTELALYRGAWQQVPLYIQFIVITRATSNMPKYIGFTKLAARTCMYLKMYLLLITDRPSLCYISRNFVVDDYVSVIH